MRNLLGRLHSRRMPELIRIAAAWNVPLLDESKSDVVSTLYRAMIDPRAVRDLWDHLTDDERAVAAVLAGASGSGDAPTVGELAARLGIDEERARTTALGLYRAGILAREGDDEPLPVGALPRLLMPREVALNFRRIEDEMAAGDLARAPLRVLIELLDDGELEGAARAWGLRTLPGVSPRQDLASRVLRLVNDASRIERVVQGRSRDAAGIWRAVRAAEGPIPLHDAAEQAGLSGTSTETVARRRNALAELEGSLLVWHAYHRDGTRWLFIPAEIRDPGESVPAELPPLHSATLAEHDRAAWHSPNAVAWDLLTILRVVSGRSSPIWDASAPAPRWLSRAVAHRLWFGERDGTPPGYLELLRELGMAEGVLVIDEGARTPRIVPGPHARAWRERGFRVQTDRLRERWLRWPRWVEGEPAGIVELWGADWRGLRPRLLAALGDPEIGLVPDRWVTLESLSARIVARFPALLGPSLLAATARMAGEAGAGASEEEARAAALGDVVSFELGGPFVWFGITRVLDRPGQPRAVSVTASGAALAARKPLPAEADAGESASPVAIGASGELALQLPTPHRVWALSAFAELVDLGPVSHYRITETSFANALHAGIERDQIVTFLERVSGGPLPPDLATSLDEWSRALPRAELRRAVVVRADDDRAASGILATLREQGWSVEAHGSQAVVVTFPEARSAADGEEDRLAAALHAAGLVPHWTRSHWEDGQTIAGDAAAKNEGVPD